LCVEIKYGQKHCGNFEGRAFKCHGLSGAPIPVIASPAVESLPNPETTEL